MATPPDSLPRFFLLRGESHRNIEYPSMVNSASLCDWSQVSDKPINSCFSEVRVSFMNGTFEGTVCGQRPCMFINENLLIAADWALAAWQAEDKSGSVERLVEEQKTGA